MELGGMLIEAFLPELAAGVPADAGLVALLGRVLPLVLGPPQLGLLVGPLAVPLVGAPLPLELVVTELGLLPVGRGGEHGARKAKAVSELPGDLGG